jgi:hypothetical protein
MTLMSGPIHELLYRNLQEVFGEGNAARRQAAIDELYTEDCVLYCAARHIRWPRRP